MGEPGVRQHDAAEEQHRDDMRPVSHVRCDDCGNTVHVTALMAIETYWMLNAPMCPHKFCVTCCPAGCVRCGINSPAMRLFAAAECQICKTPGEFDFLACGGCIRRIARAVEPGRVIGSAVFHAAGTPSQWHSNGQIRCNIIVPIGQYIVAGVVEELERINTAPNRTSTIEIVSNRVVVRTKTAPPRPLWERMAALSVRGEVSLQKAADAFSAQELRELIETQRVVFIHSCPPKLSVL